MTGTISTSARLHQQRQVGFQQSAMVWRHMVPQVQLPVAPLGGILVHVWARRSQCDAGLWEHGLRVYSPDQPSERSHLLEPVCHHLHAEGMDCAFLPELPILAARHISLRSEYFDVTDWRTGFATAYNEWTLGWQHWLSPQVELRPEIAWYHSLDVPAFDNGTKHAITVVSGDVIWHF